MTLRPSTPATLVAAATVLLGPGGISPAAAQPSPTRIVSFQPGVDGYENATQLRLRANGQVENGADIPFYYLDGSPFANEADDTVDVLRFGDLFGTEPGRIPAGATILDAQLIYSTGDVADAITGGPYQLGRLLEEVPLSATYTDYPLDPPARRSVRSLTAEPWLAAAASVQLAEAIPVDVTEVVQAWSGGAPNHGVTVFANDTTDGWQLCSISHPEPARRPRLTVTFTTNAVRRIEIHPAATSVLRPAGVPEDAAALATAMIANNADPAGLLLRFDPGDPSRTNRLGPRDRVLSAKLSFRTAGAPDYSASADSASPFGVHQVLVPWDAAANFGTNGLTVAEGDIAEAADELVGMGEWTRAVADVTPIVANWQAGQPNHGIHLKPGGSNGWQVFLGAATNVDWRPTLRIWAIEYNGAPSAGVQASTLAGNAPLPVSFDASASVDPDGEPLLYAWNFGDGQTGTGVTVQHTFADPGLYRVVLTVTDTEGKTAESIVTVKAQGSPVARVTTGLLRGPEPFRLAASAAGSLDPDGGSIRYRWSLGDGTEAETESVEHTYHAGGRFPLRLTVTDDEGLSITVTNTVEVLETSVRTAIFQQGRDGYAGTFERRVQANGFAQMGRDVAEYYLDGRPQTAAQATNDTCELIRFDALVGTGPGQIPASATVVRATLTYHSGTDVNANTDGPYVLGYLTKPVGDTTTYDALDSGTGVNEERGPRGSVEPLLLAGFSDIEVREVVSADVTPFVQRWVNGEPNQGLAIFTDDTTDGWQISTVGHSEIERRPRLTVDYTTGSVTRRRFPAVRSAIAAKAAVTLDGSLLESSFLDGGADADYKEALLAFDPLFGTGAGQIPAGDQVLIARLVTRTGGVPNSSADADSDDPYSVHEMREVWNVEADFGTNGVSLAAGQAGPAVAAFLGMGERTWAPAEITSVVLDWAEGRPQHGLNIKPQGSDGWQIHWPGHPEPELHPYLEVLSEKALPTPVTIRVSEYRPMPQGGFALTWSSGPGATYTVQASVDLVTWAVEVPSIASQGTATSVTVPPPANPAAARYFRVVGNPSP